MKRHIHSAVLILAVSAILGVGSTSARASSLDKLTECAWDEGFHVNGLDGAVHAIASQETPEGPRIYVGGRFKAVDGSIANHVAEWHDGQWKILGDPESPGLDDEVRALAIWDDGTGPALYAAGDFKTAGGKPAHHIARWDGQEWTALGPASAPGLSGIGFSIDLQAFDDGTGPALYIASRFSSAGGVAVSSLARWDGTQWSRPAPEGVNYRNAILTVWDDGTGKALYVGNRKLVDGALVEGFTYEEGLDDIIAWDDGSGETLFAIGHNSGDFLKKWTGNEWQSIVEPDLTVDFLDLEIFDSGSGPELVVGGLIESYGGQSYQNLMIWNGTSFRPLLDSDDLGLDWFTNVLHSVADRLLVGGYFTRAGSVPAPYLASWDGTAWSSVSSGRPEGNGIPGRVYALAEWDDGSGPSIYAAGDFEFASGERVNNIAKWAGDRWVPLQTPSGIGLSDTALAMTVWDDGSGEALYVGGNFREAAGIEVNGIAKWDGSSWSSLGTSPGSIGVSGSVEALEPWGSGPGSELYVGGFFSRAGDKTAIHLARWNGRRWASLDHPQGIFAGVVYGLAVWGQGDNESLYVGGFFDGFASNGEFFGQIARWDGNRWHTTDPELYLIDDFVWELETSSVEGTSYLYAGTNGGPKRWDGSTWIRPDEENRIYASIWAMENWDDGSGEALYLGGTSDGRHLFKWDGNVFEPLGEPGEPAGVNNAVWALEGLDDGPRSLMVGGRFEVAGDTPSNHVARWTCAPATDCAAYPDRLLCLDDERFVVDVDWRDFEGSEGSGRVVPFQTGDSGLFYFFDADNWELLIKVLDACSFNDHFWVFSAATTNVEYTLTVTDAVTGATKSYFNPLGVAAPSVTDTNAFATCDAGSAGSQSSTGNALPLSLADEGIAKSRRVTQVDEKMDCVPSDTTMCLDGGRFALEVAWRDFDGDAGPGQVVQGAPSDDSGLFQFFGENNWEVLVKVLDACGFNDRFWVFSAATTNVEYTLRVTDTETGESVSYFNPLGNAASAVTDTDAFATCQ